MADSNGHLMSTPERERGDRRSTRAGGSLCSWPV